MLTLTFDRMGRLGQIGPIPTPCKILTLRTELKKIGRWNLSKYPLSKQNKQKNVFEGDFPAVHNYVTDYIILSKKFITYETFDLFFS